MKLLDTIVRHWELKILALVLAGLVWLHVVTNQTFELDIDYGLDYVNLPSTLIMAAPPPVRATVRLRSSGKTLLRLLWQDRRWPVDLSSADAGVVTVRLRPESTPRYGFLGLEALALQSPEGLSLLIDSLDHKSVPAQLGADLQVAPGFTFVGDPILSPDVVRLTGPRGALAEIDGVRTRSTSMPDLRETLRTTISLTQPPGYNIEMEPRTVGLYRQVEPYATRALTAVPVRIIGAQAEDSLRVSPNVVTVENGGPRSAAFTAIPESVQVVYRAAADDTAGALVGLRAAVAPPLSVLKVEPDSVTLQRRERSRPHILGIETSCDETAAAVASPDGRILSNIIFSQTLHAAYGGVVPELASREHAGRLPTIVTEALSAAQIGWGDLAGIAVTAGPGLVGCLLVGVAYARAAARARGIPVIGVNHLEGHAHTPAMTAPDSGFPQLVLIVSGGHTLLVVVTAPGQFQCLGRTRDDAAGECFDKVGKLLGFNYPAGPDIDRAGEDGAAIAVAFPKTRFDGQGYDYSFSGIKTAAALDWEKRQRGLLPAVDRKDWIASFEQAIVDSLTRNLFRAAEDQAIPIVALAGGVARNRRLRLVVSAWAKRTGRRAIVPAPELCADNAAMIAAVGSYRWQPDPGDAALIDAVPSWGLGEPPPWTVTT